MINKNFKISLNEGRNIFDGSFNYGGFPRILNEAKKANKDYDKDGNVESSEEEYLGSRDRAIKDAMGQREATENDNYSDVGTYEMLKILKGGGHPLMSHQTVNGVRGVPDDVRREAIAHLEAVRGIPDGPTPNYSNDHPNYKKGKAAHDFFEKHFNSFGVHKEIADRFFK